MTGKRNYWDLPGFGDVYLEDSWVIDIMAGPSVLLLELDVVLRESHPDYTPPQPGKQYCYKKGRLVFRHVTELHWRGQGLPPATDASGEIDYGSVDEMTVDGPHFRLQGDFGSIEVVAEPPRIEWVEISQSF